MHSENYRLFCYQTRIFLKESEAEILEDYAAILSRIERKLFADISAGKIATQLKSEYLKKYRITARQFNALRVQVEGKIASIKERLPLHISETEYKIQNVQKTIQKLEKKPQSSHKLHQKKRYLHILQQKLQRLKSDQKSGKVHLCYGSKRLFHAQFNLDANGYRNHQEWLEDWRQTRNNSFFLLGSKDENNGNQSCTATLSPDGSLTLRIRLPDCLAEKHEKYLVCTGIRFSYGHEEIVKAIHSCETRKQLQKQQDPNYIHYGLSLSYRFKKDEKGWRIFVSVPMAAKTSTSTKQGVIGVDINANHLAITETDRFGNPISSKTIKLNTYGKNKNQTKALIGDACTQIVKEAYAKGKSLAIENLNFQKKKAQLREQRNSSYARMLSSLAYNSIKNNLEGQSWKQGITIEEINPAFTSTIGRIKFSKRYGLSIHHAAALTIGRRCLKFSEKVPSCLESIPDGKGDYVALSLPVRNADKHVWSTWKDIDRELKTVLAAHFRAKRTRSSGSKKAPGTEISEIIGEIPIRESVDTTARSACLDLSIFA